MQLLNLLNIIIIVFTESKKEPISRLLFFCKGNSRIKSMNITTINADYVRFFEHQNKTTYCQTICNPIIDTI